MEIGEYIPDELGIDAEGRNVTANGDYARQPMIIYFYPKDNTPGCTAEACSLRDGYAELSRMGYAAVSYTHLDVYKRQVWERCRCQQGSDRQKVRDRWRCGCSPPCRRCYR